MQPVCDRRVVSCVNGIAKGHKLLLKIVAASLILEGYLEFRRMRG